MQKQKGVGVYAKPSTKTPINNSMRPPPPADARFHLHLRAETPTAATPLWSSRLILTPSPTTTAINSFSSPFRLVLQQQHIVCHECCSGCRTPCVLIEYVGYAPRWCSVCGWADVVVFVVFVVFAEMIAPTCDSCVRVNVPPMGCSFWRPTNLPVLTFAIADEARDLDLHTTALTTTSRKTDD